MVNLRMNKSTLIVIVGAVYLAGRATVICKQKNTDVADIVMELAKTMHKECCKLLDENIKLRDKIKELESKEEA